MKQKLYSTAFYLPGQFAITEKSRIRYVAPWFPDVNEGIQGQIVTSSTITPLCTVFDNNNDAQVLRVLKTTRPNLQPSLRVVAPIRYLRSPV